MDIFMYIGLAVTLTYLGMWAYSLIKKKPKNLIENKDFVSSTQGFIEYTGTPPRVGMYPPSKVNGVKVH